MKTAVIGFPRIGIDRELKFACEKYFKQELTKQELQEVAANLRRKHWKWQAERGIDYIASNDFSFYDAMLDTAWLLGAIPKKYKDLGLKETDTYFAMARGYQGDAGDVPALAMKKWFNTNYHYIVPELEKGMVLRLQESKMVREYQEAKAIGISTIPVLIGPFTFLKLAYYEGERAESDFAALLVRLYQELLEKLEKLGVEWVQIQEPMLVTDLKEEDTTLFFSLYQEILKAKGKTKVLLQTYFGDVRDCYEKIMALDFDGIGLDFVEGEENFRLLEKYGFDKRKILFAGLINGKNIWKSNFEIILKTLKKLETYAPKPVLSTSCSLLHIPYSLEKEQKLGDEVKEHLSFAIEKLEEMEAIKELRHHLNYQDTGVFLQNQRLHSKRKTAGEKIDKYKNDIKPTDFVRTPPRAERFALQKKKFDLPPLPTTTIGSFPQTWEVKENRALYREGSIDKKSYVQNIFGFIADCIQLQEEIGLDVLVHGEFERSDMVEFFGEHLQGFVLTEAAWVQSYGTRVVKPPILFSDIHRTHPITTEYLAYAKGLTQKPVKGMLTGPVTILNWSFPREDISLKEMAFQLAVAIREEVLDLERAGIRMIQIDEAALKEKLPLRKEDWHKDYLDWAIPAFRLCHSKVAAETQIHTHMCYSEFADIIEEIDEMDADVIYFEASRSKLSILESLKAKEFETQVGAGVYDIHSPRVPAVDEIEGNLRQILQTMSTDKVWVNPDCGLKTRGIVETVASLKNLTEAARRIRQELSSKEK